MARFKITHNFNDLLAAFKDLADNHRQTIIARSLNDVGRRGRTTARKELVSVGGWKRGYVNRHTNLFNASRASLEARIIGKSRYSLVTQFSPSLRKSKRGSRVFLSRAKPWNQTRTYTKAFLIRSKFGSHMVPVVRKGRGLHALYGPSIGREMERPAVNDAVMARIGTDLPVRTVHYAGVYMNQLKGRYRL